MKDIANIMSIAASGMKAQSSRMRIIAENVANADSTGRTPDDDPYRRQMPTFESELDRAKGVRTVRMSEITPDMSDFDMRYEPGHPAADADGYVKTPNVNTLIELMDMREAQRSFEANMNVMESSRAMLMRTIDLLRR
ncbi:MAG: flagellar basal body rod protein FlgC [Euryhalocaulis sp.]|uniref:flagellar basal body rod protein FlgC n=1 Tax=Euryhalocaulis sp. TaxID=2744307 RepID=UPI0017C40962|nr:flagellar basal body rod protein FlgC [Euryhalocaulis sp.]MBA4802351.1 flagellar basal body rod protein FlgC [Euryhalocaulis sp.]